MGNNSQDRINKQTHSYIEAKIYVTFMHVSKIIENDLKTIHL